MLSAKPADTADDLAASNVFNTFFTALACMDYSAYMWALESGDLDWLVGFAKWRMEKPFFTDLMAYLMLVILLVFPFIVLLIWYSALQTIFRLRTATLSRHALDLIEAAAISVILYIGFMRRRTLGHLGTSLPTACVRVVLSASGSHF